VTRRPRLFVLLAVAGLLAAACATLQPQGVPPTAALSARVNAALDRRGLGPDALSVIDNILRYDTTVPPAAPPMVRELLAQPLAAVDADALFQRALPSALRRFADEASAPARVDDAGGARIAIRDLVDVYVGELAAAQELLRAAVRGKPVDIEAVLRELGGDLPSAERLQAISAAVDPAALDRANNAFLNATARFVRILREVAGRIEFPDRLQEYDSAVGIVVLGTRGNDVYEPGAAVIVDPGGDDTYMRAPAVGGAVSVIVDLGGNDGYRGSDVAVQGFSAIVDFSGNDRYAMSGPGLGAAVAGASVLLDFAGDDSYEAQLFGEGAAAFGLGALIDLGGNDSYRLRAGGQGFAAAGGAGLLWDRGGNDTYTAAGLADEFDRGGGLSWAQGAAYGYRTMLGGGVGILRDDSGDDAYEAQMFAQGAGYYYSLGLLWDGAGADRYRAVRYAQGTGVHEAVGVLCDESGDDRYELGVGVGQGMGLDLGVGALFDGGGDDRYDAPALAQGTATDNGFGILVDAGGADRWSIGADEHAWGRAGWARGLPTVGVLLYDPARVVFEREGKPFQTSPESAQTGGPMAMLPAVQGPPGKPRCATADPAASGGGLPLAESLRRLEPGFTGGTFDAPAYAEVQRRLTESLEASIAELPVDDFDVLYPFSLALGCALADASPGNAARIWDQMEKVLVKDPATPFAGAITAALRGRRAPEPQMQRILDLLDAHPRCGVRAAALSLRYAAAGEAPRAAAPLAQAALGSPCWRLQTQALAVLKRLGAAPGSGAKLPSFLGPGRGAPAPN
jgi:hypothetical protein